jgi:hypothetical protein
MVDDGSTTHTKALDAFARVEAANVQRDGSVLGNLTESLRTGDEGIDCAGHMHIGNPGAGRELVVGEGDSHTIGMVVFCTPDGGTTWCDNTSAAASGSGSTFEAFGGGLAINSATYVGSDTLFEGIKLLTSFAAVPDTGLVVSREYWNGSAWTPFKMLVTNADRPYTQRADDAGTVVGSEQLRFSELTNHAKSTVDGVEKYWIRFRISAGAFTTSGVIEQIKLHTDRWECNADGFTEYFGGARYWKDLTMHWGLTLALQGLTPASETIDFATNISLVYAANRLTHTTIDGRGGYVVIPDGLDTSNDVQIEVLWYPVDNGSGDVVLQFDAAQISEGDTLDGTIATETETETVNVPANNQYVLRKTTYLLDVQNNVPGEILAFALRRLTAGNSYSNGITLANVRAIGRFWKP